MTTIVIAGGHGQIALRLAALLCARGDAVRATFDLLQGETPVAQALAAL